MKKFITTIISILILAGIVTAFALPALAADVPYVCVNVSNAGIVDIYGRFTLDEESPEKASFFLLNPDKTPEDMVLSADINDAIAHMDFIEVSESGEFSYRFKTTHTTSDYTIYIKFGSQSALVPMGEYVSEGYSMGEGFVIDGILTDVPVGTEVTLHIVRPGAGINNIEEYSVYSDQFILDETLRYFASEDTDGINSFYKVYIKAGDKVIYRNLTQGEIYEERFVALGGSDSADGTEESPLATMEGAKAMASSITASGKSAKITFKGGTYPIISSISFGEEDSAPEGTKIIYAAEEEEKVVFSASKVISPSDLESVSDIQMLNRFPYEVRDKIRVIDLSEYQITASLLNMNAYSAGYPGFPLGLYLNGVRQQVSRWPNEGFVKTGDVSEVGEDVTTGANSGKRAVFTYVEQAPDMWKNPSEAFVIGYLSNEFHHEWARIGSVDADNKTITLSRPTKYGVAADSRYAVINLPEEMDIPGEYYLEADNGLLYYYPPYELGENDSLEINAFGGDILKINNAQNLVFDGITFCHSKGNGISINNSDSIGFYNCIVTGFGLAGIVVGSEGASCNNITIADCMITDVGYSGINIASSGQRSTHTSGNIVISGNTIYNTAFSGAGNDDAALEIGKNNVGVIARNNVIHGNDGYAVRVGGNANIICNNEIYNVIRDVGDAGAIYLWASWSEYGNIIENNFIHDIYNDVDGGTAGVYLDDWHSGTVVKGNIFSAPDTGKNFRGILVGNGRDITLTNNMFVNTPSPMYLRDRYGDSGWAPNMSVLMPTVNQVDSTAEPFKTLYPAMANLKSEAETAYNGSSSQKTAFYRDFPKGTKVSDNLAVESGSYKIDSKFRTLGSVTNPVVTNDTSIFIDYENGNYKLADGVSAGLGLSSQGIFADDFSMNSIGTRNTDVLENGFGMTYPHNNTVINSDSVFLSWTKADLADRYTYRIATDAAMENIVMRGSTSANVAKVSGLTPGVTYYWNVEAENISHINKDSIYSHSGVWSFTVSASPVTLVNKVLYDTNNRIIKTLDGKDGKVTVKCELKNITDEKTDFKLIAVLLNEDGKIEATQITESSLQPEEQGVKSFELDFEKQCGNGWYMECYIWDDISSIKPLLAKKIILP